MSDIAISVEKLAKSYLVGHNSAQAESYTALRDVVTRNARNLARKTRDMLSGRAIVQGDEVEEFWALKDVSFEVKRGEVLGVIGRNGAGKSTLLKILSRITEPTSGRIKIAGRVASLLEVGTGFHPELTGRENIFLNGAILGMRREEILRKFDEIVDFSGVEKFLDTPVKRYSSGMYVRLAFAVAAHLEPEILIIDEVLAVGDAEFQKKCLGKMQEVGKDGRTVLFVSHNMAAIQSLCSSAIYLKFGNVAEIGPCRTLIDSYLTSGNNRNPNIFPLKLSKSFSIRNFIISESSIQTADSINIAIEIESIENEYLRDIALLIYSNSGERISAIDLRQKNSNFLLNSENVLIIKTEITSINLVEGGYSFGVYIVTNSFSGNVMELADFNVSDKERSIAPYPASVRGIVDLDFSTRYQLESK